MKALDNQAGSKRPRGRHKSRQIRVFRKTIMKKIYLKILEKESIFSSSFFILKERHKLKKFEKITLNAKKRIKIKT